MDEPYCMNIEFYSPYWGSEALPFTEFVKEVQVAGYDGVEMSFPDENILERDRRVAILRDAGLKLIAQHWETEVPHHGNHLEEYRRRLTFLTGTNPVFISSQTGRDFFPFEQNMRLLTAADEISGNAGVPILHETHRSKLTFAAHITRKYLEKFPAMRLTLDISHWFCVHERYLNDQAEALELAISRSDHIHARIGHDQGSQVPDFRVPEWAEVLEKHLLIWDRIRDRAVSDSRHNLTVTPEFGPPPYMLRNPADGNLPADQCRLNRDMMNLLKERWN